MIFFPKKCSAEKTQIFILIILSKLEREDPSEQFAVV